MLPEHSRTLGHAPGCSGTLRNAPGCSRTLRDTPGRSWTLRDALGIVWDALARSRMLWDSLVGCSRMFPGRARWLLALRLKSWVGLCSGVWLGVLRWTLERTPTQLTRRARIHLCAVLVGTARIHLCSVLVGTGIYRGIFRIYLEEKIKVGRRGRRIQSHVYCVIRWRVCGA